jgi:hypothetical protein
MVIVIKQIINNVGFEVLMAVTEEYGLLGCNAM